MHRVKLRILATSNNSGENQRSKEVSTFCHNEEIKGDISKRDGAVKHSQGVFLRQVYVIRKNGLGISLITHDRRPV